MIQHACFSLLGVVQFGFATLVMFRLQARHTLSLDKRASILHMVQSGVGVWVAFQGSAVVYLIHLETMEHLQEMSVDATVNRILLGQLDSFLTNVEDGSVDVLGVSGCVVMLGHHHG